MDFNTRIGSVKLTSPTSDEMPDSDIRDKLNTVVVTEDPSNTYGLATKFMVTSSMDAHNTSPDAHSGLFNAFLSQLYDLYAKQGELKINAITDIYSNTIYANRKVVAEGDAEHPKFIVCSDDRNADYDALLRRVEALEVRLGVTDGTGGQ